MNIVIINDYACVQGGAAQVAIQSSRGLADLGHTVYFVYAVGPADPILIHKNIHLVDLKQSDLLSNPSKLNAALSGIWNIDAKKRIDEFLKCLDPMDTIIHVHTWVKSLSCSAISSCLKQKFNIVLTLHDYFTACPNGGFYNYQTKKPCTLPPMSGKCISSNCDSRNYPQKIWRVLRQAVTEYSGVPGKILNFIYVSEFSKSILSPHLPINSTYWNIPNPIDLEKSEPSSPNLSDTFTFVGRLSPEKGVELFAKAALEANVNTRFVGTGELANQIKKTSPQAELTGWADRESVSNYIKDSRAVVFPSEWYETQGLVVAEAAALGTPCIVSDSCAGRDYIEHNITGLIFKSGNIESLAETLRTLKDSPTAASRLGANAYSRYWSCPPTLKKHVLALEGCYKSILKK